jgi:hypothetical protein
VGIAPRGVTAWAKSFERDAHADMTFRRFYPPYEAPQLPASLGAGV